MTLYGYLEAWFGSSVTTIVTYPVHLAPEFPSDLYVDPKLLILLNILDDTCADKLSCLPHLSSPLPESGYGALQGIQDGFYGPSCLLFLVTWGQISREHTDAAKPHHQR